MNEELELLPEEEQEHLHPEFPSGSDDGIWLPRPSEVKVNHDFLLRLQLEKNKRTYEEQLRLAEIRRREEERLKAEREEIERKRREEEERNKKRRKRKKKSGIAGFDPILISLVRRAMPNLIAYDVCGVQPMVGPTGLIFAMKSKYDKDKKPVVIESKETPMQTPVIEAEETLADDEEWVEDEGEWCLTPTINKAQSKPESKDYRQMTEGEISQALKEKWAKVLEPEHDHDDVEYNDDGEAVWFNDDSLFGGKE
jgi:Major capsid protein Gp23